MPGIPSADIQDGSFDGFIDQPWNVARKNNKFPAAASYPALYRYHDSWTVLNEFTIDRLARGAVSVIPLIVNGGFALEPPASGVGGEGGAGPGTTSAGDPDPSVDGSNGQGGNDAIEDGSGGAPDDADADGMDDAEQINCSLPSFGAKSRGGALGFFAAASLLALTRRLRRDRAAR